MHYFCVVCAINMCVIEAGKMWKVRSMQNSAITVIYVPTILHYSKWKCRYYKECCWHTSSWWLCSAVLKLLFVVFLLLFYFNFFFFFGFFFFFFLLLWCGLLLHHTREGSRALVQTSKFSLRFMYCVPSALSTFVGNENI